MSPTPTPGSPLPRILVGDGRNVDLVFCLLDCKTAVLLPQELRVYGSSRRLMHEGLFCVPYTPGHLAHK